MDKTMDALELLANRVSQPRLAEPAPGGEALQVIKQAALRAPDHACLKPWRFIVCQGEGLDKLGKLFQQAAIEAELGDKDVARAPELPKRAPMVIVAIAKYTEHPKVPRVEQIASASCAVYAMQLAIQAQGFSSMWRTGRYATDPVVKAGLSASQEDEIVGFLYVGTPVTKALSRPGPDTADFFETI